MDKIEVTREEVVEMYNALLNAKLLRGDPQITYALGRTKRSLRDPAESITEGNVPSDEFNQFNKLRDDLCQKFALKDGKGRPLSSGNQWVMDPDKAEEFEKAAEDLKAKYEKALKEEEERRKGFKAWKREKMDVKVHKVKLSALKRVYNKEKPEESLTVDQMDALAPMIIVDFDLKDEKVPE